MTKNDKKVDKDNNINETFSYRVVYIYSVPDEKHIGSLIIFDIAYLAK